MPWRNDPESRRHTAITYGADWRQARAVCLRRAGNRCQIRQPGCQRTATEVDHIQPVSQGGTHEQANLRAACQSCHAKVTATQGGGYRNANYERPAYDPGVDRRTSW